MSETMSDAAARVRQLAGEQSRIVFVSGNFNVVHPGHLRVLNFAAECGDFLVVGVNSDDSPGALLPADLRLEGVRAVGIVDVAILLGVAPEHFLEVLRPDIVVKGKEHEEGYNSEQAVLDAYGGKLLFASGEVRFSSYDLLRRELQESNRPLLHKPGEYLRRHSLDSRRLIDIAKAFAELKVVVVGDLIVDEYITCDPVGMSQEDPTIVVTPIQHDRFVGGAGIVAAHARGLGANVSYFSAVGNDETATFAADKLKTYGVESHVILDESRPTTLKQRYRARGKTLLRVSHLRQHDVSQDIAERLLEQIKAAVVDADLVVFSDFNYGCLPQPLVNDVVDFCVRSKVPMVADSQSSSQLGDISRFEQMLLITPTEREARLAVRDSSSGLVALADALRAKARAQHVFITLGSEGMLLHSPDSESSGVYTDQLPALNGAPRDVSGAGDSLLTCASLALVAGASIWESAYLGSVAAACQVGRIGNTPLSSEEIFQELRL